MNIIAQKNNGISKQVRFFNLDLFFKIVPIRKTSIIITIIKESYLTKTDAPKENPQKIRLKKFWFLTNFL